MLNLKDILTVSLVLFSVIDIVGSIPIVIDLRKKFGHVQSEKATLISAIIMLVFLFMGESFLSLFGVDVSSFAIAGALVLFIMGLEMILGAQIFKSENTSPKTISIVPIAFPMIAGAGTLTTIISLRAEYSMYNVAIGIVLNLVLVYLVLKSCNWLERKIGQSGFDIIRRVFGIILLSIAIKLFKNNWFL